MAGDPAVQAMALSILLGQTIPGGYGLYDAVTGEVNHSNSGELAMNSYLAGLPLMGLIGGATGVALADPAAGATLGGLHMSTVKAKKGQSPTAEEVATFMRDANAAASREMKRNPGMSKQEAVALAGKRGLRNLVGGGLAGTLAGGIPAMMLMQDPSQNQGA
jgi:hypothetical protein